MYSWYLDGVCYDEDDYKFLVKEINAIEQISNYIGNGVWL
jgi:hypothetical protein